MRPSESRPRSVSRRESASDLRRRNLGHLGHEPGHGRHRRRRRRGLRAVTRRRGRGCRRRAVAALEGREHQALLDLHRRRAREVLVRPHAPAANLLVAGESLVGVAHDRVGDRRVIGKQHRVHPYATPVAVQPDDRGVPDPIVPDQHRLHVVGVHLLAIGQRDHVLLAPAQGQEAVAAELAEIAGVVPAVGVDRGRRRLGVLPIADEAVRAADEHFAVIGNPHLHSGNRLAHRADPVPVGAREADCRAHLGGAISLDGGDTHVRPERRELGVEGGSADGEVPEPPAELGEDRAEQEPPHEARQARSDGVQPVELRALAGGVDLALDRVREQPQPLRNDEHHRDLELAEGLDEDRRLPADRVGDGLAGGEWREEVAGQPEHVRQRQHRQQALVRAEREHVDEGPGVRGDVAVGQHHALRVAGRARGEHHEQQVVGRDVGRRQSARLRGRDRGVTRSGSPAGRAGAPAPRSGVTRARASARSARRPWRRSRRCSAHRAARRRARRAPRPGTRAPTPGG